MDFRHLLQDGSRITDEDVLRFRREVFQDAVVSRAEAEGVFALNNAISDTSTAWNEFFVEAMVDYCVNQARPRGYMTENNAEWLIEQITRDGRLDKNSELELVVKVIERATEVPASFAAFALEQVEYAVLEGNGPLLCNSALVPGVIGKPEAQLIRRIMYGAGAEGRLGVSRQEAEVLFDLNDKTVEAENHPEWNDVFVKAIACHLMMVSGYQALDRKEVLRREAWLDDTSIDVGGFLSKTLSHVGDIMRGKSAFKLSDVGQDEMETAFARRNDDMEAGRALSNPVDELEARWLIDRIGRDGVLHENEKALISYLKKESPSLHTSLQPLLEKVA